MRTLVIDVGTSGLRAAIVHDDASVSDLHYEEFAPDSPFAGLVEFDATAMYAAVHRVAVAALASGPVTAVGITTQRASTIIWRASTGKPIGPSLGWQDLRTVGECMAARAEHGFTFAPNQTATKAVWMLANYISDANERNSDDLRIGTVESWIVYNLTQGAQHVTDHTNAAVTGLTLPDGTVVTKDDGPRDGTTAEGLSQSKPAFRPDGQITAGNACPLNDGAAAVLVMSAAKAKQLGLTPLARIISSGVSGLNPEIMGLGPIEACRQALKRAGMTIDNVDLVEINEAFAAQVIPSAKHLGISMDKLNIHGGAIALGHPLGASGTRLMTTLLNELERTGGRYGLQTMCEGGGMANATIIERLG